MARAAVRPEEERPPHDALEGTPLPRANALLFGHRGAERAFLDAYRSGRMHHGWIISGERGIGRATLAFRLARFMLAHPDPKSADVAAAKDLSVAPGHPAAARVAAGTHPNILHLQREWIDKDKRFRTELTVDSVRRIIPFVGTTAGEQGWRIAIVDPADDMNRSAANAVLKNLEEPPRQTLFLLLTRSRGTLLPTIRSRCRTLDLSPLSAAETAAAVRAIRPDIAPAEGGLAGALAGGSPRRMIELLQSDGIAIYRLMLQSIESGDRRAQIELSARSSDAAGLRRLMELYEEYLARRVRGQPVPAADAAPNVPLVTWAKLWEKAALSGQEVEEYNLDRRQFALDLLEISAAAVAEPGFRART